MSVPDPVSSDPAMAEAGFEDPGPFESPAAQERLAHPVSAQQSVLQRDPTLDQLAQADPFKAAGAVQTDPPPEQEQPISHNVQEHPISHNDQEHSVPHNDQEHSVSHNDQEHPVSHNDPAQVQDAAAQAITVIEAGSEEDSSSDAGYGSDESGSTSTSLSSSVRDYAFENGRRYHKFRQGYYNLPNDDQEQHREDMKHAMALAACGDRLHFAPIGDDPQHVVDLGTGTGIWAVEMGDTYPSAQVLGIDLSPIQPTWVPPNVRFMVDDAESEWLYPRDYFDLVHARHCNTAIKDWPRLFANAFTHVRPGGWVEVQDIVYMPRCDDGSMSEEYQVKKWLQLVHTGFETLGVDLGGASKLEQLAKDAGFANVEAKVVKLPIGKWARNPLLKKVGLYLQAVIMDGLEGISLGPLCRGLKWTKEEVEVLLAGVRRDLRNTAIHSYFVMYTVYGQKPGFAI